MGDGMKTLKEVEKSNVLVARKSIVAKVILIRVSCFVRKI